MSDGDTEAVPWLPPPPGVDRREAGTLFRQAVWQRRQRRKEDIVAIATVNPATGETVKTFDEMGEDDVERCLAAAAAAYTSYRLTK